MSAALEALQQPIVALACQDTEGEFHFFHCNDPIKLKDIDFQDDLIRIGDFYLVYSWFDSVIVCTEEILEEVKRELQNA